VVHSPEVRWLLTGARIPVVETWDLTPTPIDMLMGFSNEAIGRAAADYLVGKGRRRLALVVADDQGAQLRRAGFAAAARERGAAVVAEVVLRAPATLGMGREALGRLLGQGQGARGRPAGAGRERRGRRLPGGAAGQRLRPPRGA
jgi:LacI family transcriptional regulator, gluconate utilization system Gnt-I transcriptional repressor